MYEVVFLAELDIRRFDSLHVLIQSAACVFIIFVNTYWLIAMSQPLKNWTNSKCLDYVRELPSLLFDFDWPKS